MTKSHDESLAEARRTFDSEPPAKPEKKALSAFDEAKKLKAALDKVEARKAAAIAKTEERAMEMRNELLRAASPKVVAVLEAAENAT